MSYSKTDWTNNSAPAINADNLNKIEQGIYDNDAAIASANTNIGTLTNLTTTEKSNLVGAINEVDGNTDINTTNIGDLSDLETTAQTDIVSAINEVNSKSEISNDYGTAQNLGYSQEYVNDRFDGTKPMGDVVVDSIRTKNMYNPLSDVQDQILNSSGGLTQGTGYKTSVLIKVKPNTNYTISRIMNTSIVDPAVDNTMRIGYFTSSKTFISRPISTDAIWTVTTPANCEYVKISYQHTVSGQEYCYNVQLEEGDTATTYTPYQELDNQEVYSVNETIIGTWDGKPLYRKIVAFASPTGSTSSVSVPSLAIANAVLRNYHAVIVTSNGYAINENYQESTYAAYSMAIRLANGNVYFPQHSAITTSATITLTVEYTKTTD